MTPDLVWYDLLTGWVWLWEHRRWLPRALRYWLWPDEFDNWCYHLKAREDRVFGHTKTWEHW